MTTGRNIVTAPTWDLLDGVVIGAECIEAMAAIPDCSVDAVVTDPPYGIGFMGKEWDGKAIAEAAEKDRATRKSLGPDSASRPGRTQPRSSSAFGNEAIIAGPVRGGVDFQHWCERWAGEALRVLKPGGHLLAFGGTRTYHRLVCGVEDAGFEIRDSLMWLYGSGFPKSHDVSKAIDKAAGEDRTTGTAAEITAPATAEAEEWDGWGTALKPSHEPIVVARKPLIGTVSENVLAHGTGGLNIDACRIGLNGEQAPTGSGDRRGGQIYAQDEYTRERMANGGNETSPAGRWPANVVLSHLEECEPVGVRVLKGDQRETGNGHRPGGFAEVGAESGDVEPNSPVYGDEIVTDWACARGCPVAELDAQSGELTTNPGTRRTDGSGGNGWGTVRATPSGHTLSEGDSGGASRFFYCAKTSRAERNAGLEGFEEVEVGNFEDDAYEWKTDGHGNPRKAPIKKANHHPTVKPINLIRWLVRLVTPPGGIVLDFFLGSGTTGCAAVLEGFDFVGIEREPEYIAIAEARIAFWAPHEGKEVADVLQLNGKSTRSAKEQQDKGQISIDDLLEVAA